MLTEVKLQVFFKLFKAKAVASDLAVLVSDPFKLIEPAVHWSHPSLSRMHWYFENALVCDIAVEGSLFDVAFPGIISLPLFCILLSEHES